MKQRYFLKLEWNSDFNNEIWSQRYSFAKWREIAKIGKHFCIQRRFVPVSVFKYTATKDTPTSQTSRIQVKKMDGYFESDTIPQTNFKIKVKNCYR